jgi:hypothetical protein
VSDTAEAEAVSEVISSFRDEVASLAQVEERQLTDGLRSIRFQPANPDGAPAWLAVSQSQVVMGIGKGGRFELGTDESERRLLSELLRAAAAGQVEETTRRFSVLTRVWLSDGTVEKTSVMRLADLWTRRSTRRYGGRRGTRRYAPWLPSEAPSG